MWGLAPSVVFVENCSLSSCPVLKLLPCRMSQLSFVLCYLKQNGQRKISASSSVSWAVKLRMFITVRKKSICLWCQEWQLHIWESTYSWLRPGSSSYNNPGLQPRPVFSCSFLNPKQRERDLLLAEERSTLYCSHWWHHCLCLLCTTRESTSLHHLEARYKPNSKIILFYHSGLLY